MPTRTLMLLPGMDGGDGVIPASRADEIKRVLPSVEIVDISGPHLALVTNPDAAWNALTAFMDRTSPI